MLESAEAQAAAAQSRSVGHGPEADTERPFARTWTAESSILASDDPPSCAGEQYESVKGLRAHLADSSSGALRVAAAAQRLLKAASNRALTGPNARLGRQVATSQHTWSIHASADLRAQTLLLQTLLVQAELTASQGGEATAASDTAASDTAPSRRRGRPSDRAI